MAKYSRFRYAQATYGAAPSTLGYSVAPLTAFVYNYSSTYGRIELSWVQPTGEFTQMRIVRNQDAFPETAEDGVIIFDAYFPITELFTDDVTNSSYPGFVNGRYAYYRAWLRKTDSVWYPAGDAYVLIPSAHPTKTSRDATRSVFNDGQVAQSPNEYNGELLSTHDKLADLLPRVFTSTSESPIDEVDTSSVMYRFLGAFAATLDESLTFADLLKPQRSGRSANPTTLGLAAYQYGLLPEPFLATKSQKKMIGEARYIYSRKGTINSIEVMVESLTGYAPTVTSSSNLLLNIQDSSFYKDTGFWAVGANTTLTALETDTAVVYNVPTSEPSAIDLAWVGEVVVSGGTGSISNGNESVFTRGIPVDAETEYSFFYYAKSTSGSITPEVSWYDHFGNIIGTPVAGTALATTTSWTKNLNLFTSPVGATYAGIKLTFTVEDTYELDMVQFSQSSVDNYEEPRAAVINIASNKSNFIKNPSFENWTSTTLNSWDTTSATSKLSTTLTEGYGETYMLQLATELAGTTTLSTVADTTNAETGAFYTFSIYMQAPAGDETFTITLNADDGINDPFQLVSPAFTASTQWERFHSTFRIPSTINANSMVLTVTISGETTGSVVNFDNAQLESSYSPSDYFDGSLGFAQGALWGGTEHGSASYLYVNRISKIPRLIAELPNYLPMGTPYILSSYYGIEHKSIT